MSNGNFKHLNRLKLYKYLIMFYVYKYNLMWQLLRMEIKQTSLDNKLEKLLCFYQQYPSKENQDRINNYLKGLYVSNKHPNILQCIDQIKSIIPNVQDADIDINNVCTQDLVKLYKDYLISASENSLEGLTIVLDGAHGAAHRIAPDVFRKLGAFVIASNCTNEGEKINFNCGALYPENLSKRI